MFLEAHRVFQKEEYLTVAEKAGETIWTRGMLLKGPCLCHGFGGNAYFLESLYRYTKEEMWRHRAFMLASCTFNEEIKEHCSKYDDMTRI